MVKEERKSKPQNPITKPQGSSNIQAPDLGIPWSLGLGGWGLASAASRCLPLQLERQGSQRGKIDQNRMLAAHPWCVFAVFAAVVPDIAAAIGFGVGIDNFAIKPSVGHTQPIIVSHDRRRAYHEHYGLVFARTP